MPRPMRTRRIPKQLIDSIVFWREPEPYGTVVNPAEEQKRLQENAALGNAPTAGRRADHRTQAERPAGRVVLRYR